VPGRTLEVYRFGQADIRVAVIGGIHGGYEGNTVHLAERMIKYFQLFPENIPGNITLYIIPCANPDGYSWGNGERARFNANGVDLNRNWEYNWRSVGAWKNYTVSAGHEAFSEPETRALRDFILDHGVAAAIFYHSLGGFISYLDWSTNSRGLAECLSDTTGYELCTGSSCYDDGVSGDAVSYLASIGLAAVDIEPTDHHATDWERNMPGLMFGLQCWVYQANPNKSTPINIPAD
jgi:hypothetical protein